MTDALDIPTCADCEMIGLPMPDVLMRMEAELGPAPVRAFLADCAGRDYGIPTSAPRRGWPHGAVTSWLQREYLRGRVRVPLGPLARDARLAWTIYTRLLDGQSLSEISRSTGCALRTVSKHRARLKERGLLGNAPVAAARHPQTSARRIDR